MKEPSQAALVAAEAILQVVDVTWQPLVQLTRPTAKAPGKLELAGLIETAWNEKRIKVGEVTG